MIPRVLEPEVMESADEAHAYDAMDHCSVNSAFVTDFLDSVGSLHGNVSDVPAGATCSILDVGTGTALIPIALAKRLDGCLITAVDLSEEMLVVARRNTDAASLSHRITLLCEDAKSLSFPDKSFDAVISNSIIHHLAEPLTTLAEMIRVARDGGLLFVRDLLRPESNREVERLVAAYAAQETPHSRRMFTDSLHAALTLDEVRVILRDANLPPYLVSQTSDRHWTIAGVV